MEVAVVGGGGGVQEEIRESKSVSQLQVTVG